MVTGLRSTSEVGSQAVVSAFAHVGAGAGSSVVQAVDQSRLAMVPLAPQATTLRVALALVSSWAIVPLTHHPGGIPRAGRLAVHARTRARLGVPSALLARVFWTSSLAVTQRAVVRAVVGMIPGVDIDSLVKLVVRSDCLSRHACGEVVSVVPQNGCWRLWSPVVDHVVVILVGSAVHGVRSFLVVVLVPRVWTRTPRARGLIPVDGRGLAWLVHESLDARTLR